MVICKKLEISCMEFLFYSTTVMAKFVGPSDMTGTSSQQCGKICVISGPDVQYVFFLLEMPQSGLKMASKSRQI